MNFNEICQEAELPQKYGIGTDNWEIYVADLVDTQEQEKQESEYRKLKVSKLRTMHQSQATRNR